MIFSTNTHFLEKYFYYCFEISIISFTFEGKIKNMTDIKLSCECNNEILNVSQWDDEDEFIFVVYYYAPIRYSLWRRIKFLFSGHITYNEVVLSAENASKLADFLNSWIRQNRINTIKDAGK